MKHLVFFSGGLGSYFCTRRLLESGVCKDDIILLFNDTMTEDEDLYRFLKDAEKSLGISITYDSDGRNIWQVFHDRGFLGNGRVDPCSEELKRFRARRYVSQFSPDDIILYFGFDWTEMHRLERSAAKWSPYQVRALLCEPPYIEKEDMKIMLADEGIELPRLYRLGFSHNNCGGGCVKAGIGHFAHLLDVFPERYAEWEKNEEEMRRFLGKDVTILQREIQHTPRKKVRLSLKQLREEREGLTRSELCDIGGCGCFQE